MTVKDYRILWKRAIRLCEIEPNIDEAISFVSGYYNHMDRFEQLDKKELLLVFIGLVIYEEKFDRFYGSTSPAAHCYREVLKRTDAGVYDRELIYDIGDWAAEYSSNPYVPMGTRHHFGPRAYYEFEKKRAERAAERYAAELLAREESKRRRIERMEEGKKKVEEAKKRHQNRIKILNELRNEPIEDVLSYIENNDQPVFYYIELVEEWFSTGKLSEEQRNRILSLFPDKSTKHNGRIKRKLIDLFSKPYESEK